MIGIDVMVSRRTISSEEALAIAQKPPKKLFWQTGSVSELAAGTITLEKRFYPYWFAHVVAYADRTPFRPKIYNYLVYLDGNSGRGGLVGRIPEAESAEVCRGDVFLPRLSAEKDVRIKLAVVQQEVIRRQFLLKGPHQEVREFRLIYLPVWLALLQTADRKGIKVINALSGELETKIADTLSACKEMLAV